jgi:NAD(P)H-hydrate epimerase
MNVLCTVDEIRASERCAIDQGRPERQLMQQAGEGFAQLVIAESGRRSGHAVFLLGPGNNGGDGLVAAARLSEAGWVCTLFGYRRSGIGSAPVPPAAAERFSWVTSLAELERSLLKADLCVDAVFGIGGRAELPDEVGRAFAAAYRSRIDRGTPQWALDLPSGIDADSGEAASDAFRADVTVMLGLPKIGLFRAPALRHSGSLRLVDIGLDAPDAPPDRPSVITEAFVRRALIRRRRDTHKSEVGWLMVVGGAPGYFGAPRMAAEAAARAGAGLVCLAVPRSLVPSIASALPEATFLPLPEADFGGAGSRMAEVVRHAMPRYRALLVGPGLGSEYPVDDFLTHLFGLDGARSAIGFDSSQTPVAPDRFDGLAVVDADGLNWLARRDGWAEQLGDARLVLTPHPGELSRLTGQSTDEIVADPWTTARAAARRFRQVVVLKTGHTAVADPDGRLVLGPQVQPSLASAGTGDVLAGTIAGLLAQGMEPFDAAASGVFVAGEAAEEATARHGTLGLVAPDIIHALPTALKALYDPTW